MQIRHSFQHTETLDFDCAPYLMQLNSNTSSWRRIPITRIRLSPNNKNPSLTAGEGGGKGCAKIGIRRGESSGTSKFGARGTHQSFFEESAVSQAAPVQGFLPALLSGHACCYLSRRLRLTSCLPAKIKKNRLLD